MTTQRRVGAYAKLLGNYASDDAIIAAGEKAELLFVRGLAFCATSDSDGYITDAQLARFVGAGMKDACKRAAILVREGIWERVDDGYVIRSWLKIHASSEEKGYKRKTDRERKRGQSPNGSGAESARNPNGTHAEGVSESLNCSVVTEVVSSTEQIRSDQGRAATPLDASQDAPSMFCPKHPNGTDQPCGQCADARKRYVVWQQRQTQRANAARKARETCPDCHGAVWLDNGSKCEHPNSRPTAPVPVPAVGSAAPVENGVRA